MTRDTFDAFAPPERGRFGENEQQQPRKPAAPRVTGASNLIDLTLHLRFEKDSAIAVIPPDKVIAKWIWLPRSLIEFVRKGPSTVIEVTMPEWLAVQKGLI